MSRTTCVCARRAAFRRQATQSAASEANDCLAADAKVWLSTVARTCTRIPSGCTVTEAISGKSAEYRLSAAAKGAATCRSIARLIGRVPYRTS